MKGAQEVAGDDGNGRFGHQAAEAGLESAHRSIAASGPFRKKNVATWIFD